jgi:hypothetical protein
MVFVTRRMAGSLDCTVSNEMYKRKNCVMQYSSISIKCKGSRGLIIQWSRMWAPQILRALG